MSEPIPILLVLIVACPAAAAVLTAALGPRLLRQHSYLPTVAALLISFLCSMLLFGEVRYQQQQPATQPQVQVGFEDVANLWSWMDVADAYHPPGEANHSRPTAAPPGWLNFDIQITLRADALTAVMLCMVTFVSLLVAIYSISYMHGDGGLWRFFTYIALFVFSMTMLVSVSNFLLLYVFWEAVGVCSYLLIGFWYQKPEAAAAGKKAFLVNRVGDFGFALAIFLIWITYGTLNFHDAQPKVPASQSAAVATNTTVAGAEVPGVLGQTRLADPHNYYVAGGTGLAICLLLLLGACGKSAQFPLHVWLPDAMEGPTPVSALIHAATMVTAGVYMVARCAPLFMVSPEAQVVVAVVGGFTALLAALIAITQFDLKRVLAYSTISQLGYMFLALGCGTFAGISAGMFHLLTHAFFKALLFLGAGSVMHAMGNVIDMRRFGGLRHRLWITCLTFGIGCYALAGLPPMAGFWSKDLILAAVQERAHDTAHAAHAWMPSVYQVLYYAGLFTAFLTAFYTFRAFFMTFFGEEELPDEAGDHAHEPPPLMWVPLALLALLAVVGGVFGVLYGGEEGGFLVYTPSLASDVVAKAESHAGHGMVAVLSILAAVSGTLLAAYLYLIPAGADARTRRWEIQMLADLLRFQWLSRLTTKEWIYALGQWPPVRAIDRAASAIYLGWLAKAIGWLLVLIIAVLLLPLLIVYYLSPYNLSQNKFYFDEMYHVAVVLPVRGLAWLSDAFDRWIIDGLVNFIGWVPRSAGSLLRSLQMGLVQFYALAMVLGMLVMIAMLLWWPGT